MNKGKFTDLTAKRIGVFGGTFDPFHNGHLAVIRAVIDSGYVDKIAVVPAHLPRLRTTIPSASPQDRLAMTRLAIEDEPRAFVSTLDIERGGETRTTDTLADMERYLTGQNQYYIVLGADAASKIAEWVSPDQVFTKAGLIVVSRPGFDLDSKIANEKILQNTFMVHLNKLANPVSGREVRSRLEKGRPLDGMVPEKVLNYILINQIY